MLRPNLPLTCKRDANKMLPVQIKLTIGMIERLDGLVRVGLYNSRSEAVRDGVRKLIHR